MGSRRSTMTWLAIVSVSLAFVVGVCVAHSPELAFAGTASVFLLAIWWFTKHEVSRYPRAEYVERLEGATPKGYGSRSDTWVSLFLLVWWFSLLLVQRVGTSIPMDVNQFGLVAREGAVSGGLLANQLLIVSYGVVGLFFLASAVRHPSKTLLWILALWLVYLCWGWITLLWSIDLFDSVRRLSGFTLISLGSIGFGAGFYGARPNGRGLLLSHIVWAGLLAALALIVPLTFRWSEVDLLDPAYVLRSSANTYSYVAMPAMVAALTLVVTPILRLRRWRRYDWLFLSILGLAEAILKVRGPFLSVVLSLIVIYFCYKIWARDLVMPIGLLVAGTIGVYVAYSGELLSTLAPYLTRDADPTYTFSISGRVPIWDHLLLDVEQHFLAGLGFGAYWTLPNLVRLEQAVGFAAVNAHNGYIEELLATGVVGLTFLLLFFVCIALIAVSKVRRGDNFAWLILLFVLLYLFINSTQSLMQLYLEIPFMFLLALVGLLGSGSSEMRRSHIKPTINTRSALESVRAR